MGRRARGHFVTFIEILVHQLLVFFDVICQFHSQLYFVETLAKNGCDRTRVLNRAVSSIKKL